MQFYLQSNPMRDHLASRTALSKYVIGLHNHVNRIYKKKKKLSLKKAKDLIKNNCHEKLNQK
jgi:hypothetical protein